MKKIISNKNPILILLILIGLGLRLIYLNQSLWLDEGIEWWAVTTFSLKQLVLEFSTGDFNPPGHYLLMWFWVRIFGDSEISMRMPSVLFGVGTIYFIYKIANLITARGRAVGFTAAALAAVNGLLIYYSQEARAYAMTAFLVTAAMYFLIDIGKRNYLYYLCLMTLGLYSHYLTWSLLPFLAILGIRFLLPVVFTIPWWPILFKQLQVGEAVSKNLVWADIGETNIKNIGLVAVKFVTGRIAFPEDNIGMWAVVGVTILTWSLVIANTIRVWRTTGSESLLGKLKNKQMVIVYWLFGPLLLGGVTGLIIPIFIYFRFLFVIPALAILLAQELEGMPGVWNGLAKLTILAIFGGFSLMYLFNVDYHREDWKGAVKTIHDVNGEALVIINPAVIPPFNYYDRGRSKVVFDYPQEIELMNNALWYMPYAQPIFDPDDKMRRRLVEIGLQNTYEKHFNGITLGKWEKI